MNADLKNKLTAYKDLTENFLISCLRGRGIPSRLLEAMEYSLMAGGKRLRPALCLAVGDLLGGKREAVLPFAVALEIIHTYTLVHDDLPAMDNDSLRRGKPTNHVVFGEATAILAGDGLLTEAFWFMTRPAALGVSPARVIEAVAEASKATGAAGTVGGQVLDMDFTGKAGVSLEELADMHARKTGQLFRISCLAGAILSEAGATDCDRLAAYGAALGAAFQIADDILDETADTATLGKSAGSDAACGKTTYPALVGLERSREMAEQKAREAVDCLAPYTGEHANFLRELALYTVERAF